MYKNIKTFYFLIYIANFAKQIHIIMKKLFLFTIIIISSFTSAKAQRDSIFNKTIYNTEEDIYIVLNLYDKDIKVKGQEFLGDMAGYIGDNQDYRKWYILESELIDANTALLSITNDEGSEDLEATLKFNQDGTYTLTQGKGSTLRTARNRKWHKLPKTIIWTTTNNNNRSY